MAFAKLFGPSVVSLERNDGSKVPVADIGGTKHQYVLLYFSAHWCPPCQMFTPTLAEFYKALRAQRQDVEIVFVSSDKSEDQFKEYFSHMPWLALPYAERKSKTKLSGKFKVEGIPSLVLLDGEGAVLNKDAADAIRGAASTAAAIAAFPWKKRSLAEVLEGATIASKDGQPISCEALRKFDSFALYFSAHWCGPCKAFTPQLSALYKKLKAKNTNMEFIFVSSDRTKDEFESYYSEMPWAAVGFDSPAKQELSDVCDVQGIPTLVTVRGSTLEIISSSARGAAAADPEGNAYPWVPVPLPLVSELSMEEDKVDALNNNCCFFLGGTEGASSDLTAAYKAAADATDASRGDAELRVTFFTVGTASSDLFQRVVAVSGASIPDRSKPFVLAARLGANKTTKVLSDGLSQESISAFSSAFFAEVVAQEE